MGKIANFVSRVGAKGIAAIAVGTVAVLGLATGAGATGDSISTVFTTTQASLVTEMGYGVALVVALLLIGLGVKMLIKWSKKGVTSA